MIAQANKIFCFRSLDRVRPRLKPLSQPKSLQSGGMGTNPYRRSLVSAGKSGSALGRALFTLQPDRDRWSFLAPALG